nr:MucBP domain-containing protein [Lactococcus lactis]
MKYYTQKEVQGNSSGQFSEKAQTVTYIYKKMSYLLLQEKLL